MTAVFRAFSGVILAVVAVAGVSAQTHHFVGGDDGWVPEMNVSSWLAGRVFKVGDKLWFKNSGVAAGILEVRGLEEFGACDFKNPIKMYTDHVALEEEGVRYFVSGNLEHCKKGLKLPVPIVTDFEPYWPGPPNPTPGFEPVKPDLAPPEPYWPAPGEFPPSEHEPPFGPYDPPVKPSFPPPEYDPPVKPSFPPPEYDPPVKPSFPPPEYDPPEKPSFPPPEYDPPEKPSFPPPEYDPPVKPSFPPPEYDPPEKPSFPPPEYDPPVKPSFPPPPQEPSYPPPSRPSGATVIEGATMMMIVRLLIGCVVGV